MLSLDAIYLLAGLAMIHVDADEMDRCLLESETLESDMLLEAVTPLDLSPSLSMGSESIPIESLPIQTQVS